MPPRVLHYSDVENAYDTPERIGKLAGTLEALRGDDAVLAGTGDNTAPGVLSLVTEGRQALDLFRAVEPDVETFGNHDFDHGLDATQDLVRESPQTWVSSNVRLDGRRFGADAGVAATATVERAGATVGFLGVTDPATPSINPEAEPLTVTDPVEAARAAADDLRDRGADYVVALSHLGRGDDRLARAVDLDAVLGGHVHSPRVDTVAGTPVVRPGSNGVAVCEVDLGDGSAARHETADGEVDPAVADALRDRMAAADLDDVVATVENPIARTHDATFGGESRVGNFVADAYRWATGADVALQNAGGLREGPALAGDVTVADLVSLVPFEEPIVVAELSGAELRRVLAEGAGDRLDFGEDDWWHAHVSGASLRRTGDGLDGVRVGGRLLDPDATYTLATSDYLLYTDDEFPTLDERHRVEEGGVQWQVLVDYAREVGVAPAVEGRVRRADERARPSE
jgi:2',3'-cyclic-nucleotide 2'-phosphodiesterase (5'-nucleotidase family)